MIQDLPRRVPGAALHTVPAAVVVTYPVAGTYDRLSASVTVWKGRAYRVARPGADRPPVLILAGLDCGLLVGPVASEMDALAGTLTDGCRLVVDGEWYQLTSRLVDGRMRAWMTRCETP